MGIKTYSEEDIDFIMNNYKILSDEELGKKLNKTKSAIKTKREKLGCLRQKPNVIIQEDEKLSIIKDYQDGVQVKIIAQKYNRDVTTINSSLRKWGIFEYKNKRWTNEEIDLLYEIYPHKTWEEILNAIPNHTKSTIVSKASELNIPKENYKWSDAEVVLLKDAYKKGMKPKEISKNIFHGKISKEEIYIKAYNLGITIDRVWKDDELEFLKNNYGKITVEEIRKTIKRKKESIVNKANQLGLNSRLKECLGESWTDEEDKFIKENYLSISDYDMTKFLEGRTWRSIKWRREKLELERPVTNTYGEGCINSDGIVFHSKDEMLVFDFIKNYSSVFKYLKNIGTNHAKKGKYVFELGDEYEYNKFYPDLVIEDVEVSEERKKLSKPIIFEYYGMARFDRTDNQIINNYNKKTLAKEKFYKSRDDIYYIGIFPEDIKQNYKGLVEKLDSFFMLNFNIDIRKIA